MTNISAADPWRCLLELAPNRSIVSGDREALRRAICNGADLRVYTEWLFEEHIAPDLKRPARPDEAGLLQEVIDFRQTIRVGDDHAAGITTLRQSMLPLVGFNPNAPPRMSFFLYDLDGRQGCANVLLDDAPRTGSSETSQIIPPRNDMPKMSAAEQFDAGTSGPSVNFIYQFERYRYFVRDDWRCVLGYDDSGRVTEGSFDALHAAHQAGMELKAAIRNPGSPGGYVHQHEQEIFTLIGSSWVHTGRRSLEGMTHPLVRITPGKPVKYASRNWDVAWIFLSTEGWATVRSLDPHTRRFRDERRNLACRWFVR